MSKPIRLLIDGYNLMFQSIVSKEAIKAKDALRIARQQMLDQLARLIEEEQLSRTLIIFDASQAPAGLPDQAVYAQMQIVFARDWDSADELMQEEIRRHSSPKQLTVVSSDHSIQRKAMARGAVAIDSETWFDEQSNQIRRSAHHPTNDTSEAASAEKNRTLSESEKAEWLGKFGL